MKNSIKSKHKELANIKRDLQLHSISSSHFAKLVKRHKELALELQELYNNTSEK